MGNRYYRHFYLPGGTLYFFFQQAECQLKSNCYHHFFYILGMVLLILLGKDGAVFNWLFMFPVHSSFFYGFRGANIATLVNFIILALITIPVYLGIYQIVASNYGIAGWICYAINFFALSTIISYALVIIIYKIDKSLKKEKKA